MTVPAVPFKQALVDRNAKNYAAVLLPHLKQGMRLLDCGCGAGSITMGLVDYLRPGFVVGADRSFGEFRGAIQYATERGVSGLGFIGADAYAIPFRDETFDAALAHSILETLERPSEALKEIRRVLKPGGVVGVASVEYGGLLLAGPSVGLLEKFYEIRQQLWLRTGIARPRIGRHLRTLSGGGRLLADRGFRALHLVRRTRSGQRIRNGSRPRLPRSGLCRTGCSYWFGGQRHPAGHDRGMVAVGGR